jgi:hypothetical protein
MPYLRAQASPKYQCTRRIHCSDRPELPGQPLRHNMPRKVGSISLSSEAPTTASITLRGPGRKALSPYGLDGRAPQLNGLEPWQGVHVKIPFRYYLVLHALRHNRCGIVAVRSFWIDPGRQVNAKLLFPGPSKANEVRHKIQASQRVPRQPPGLGRRPPCHTPPGQKGRRSIMAILMFSSRPWPSKAGGCYGDIIFNLPGRIGGSRPRLAFPQMSKRRIIQELPIGRSAKGARSRISIISY